MKSILLAAAFLGSLCWAGTNPYNIIPEPVNVTTTSGTTKNLKIIHEQKVAGLGNEGYAMKLTPGGVELRYTTPNGKAMAMATLFQLQDQLSDTPEGLPCGSIQDSPDFGWRGMMVDVGRYHYPMKEIYNFVDAMHYYKYNVLHLHLTEDQGWRLPVPGYDKLRTIGAVRPSAPESQNNSLLANEGMYTKKELQDLVAYCKARGIQVLPEVEMPGHNMALAASYPEFCCNTKRAQVWTHGGVSSKLICPQKPATKKFLKDTFNTVQQIFPFPYIHIGGDECPMGDWKKCPDCQAARAKKGQGDNVEAQMSDFTKSLTAMLAKHRKKPILWYDINKSYYHKGETVMSWLPGEFPRCIDKTKEQGIDLIVTPQFKYYLARTQMKFPADDVRARPGGAPILLKDCYNFDPRNGRDKNDVKHIKGINLCMWAEWIPSGELLMYMTYPRAMAVSETAWGSHKNRPSLEEFEKKMETHKKHFQKRFGYTLERTVENADGNFVVLNKNCSVRIENEQGRELESYQPVIGTILYVPNGGAIKKDETLATWDPYNVPVIAEKGGIVEFKDMIVGITVSKETDRETGASSLVVMEHKQELHPQVVIRDAKTREVLAHHAIPAGANLTVKDGETISAGTMVAKTPRKVAKTKDITGGLPRVAELFEARKPKDACTIARVEGIVRLSSKNTSRGKKVITIETPTGELVDHLVPMNKHVIVHEDDHVHLGDQLTEGPVSPEEILDVCGKERLQEHLVNEVQEVYRLQGVEINDKHVEIIVRQMLRKVVITEPGNTEFLWGDQVDKTTFDRINEQTVAQGGQPAAAKPVLLGITKASLETESFISAASFQDTTRVLTEASTLGKTDTLEGFKENVIMGHLIPAGTGFSRYSKIEVEPAEGAEEIASASEEEEAAELAEDMLNDTINFDNER